MIFFIFKIKNVGLGHSKTCKAFEHKLCNPKLLNSKGMKYVSFNSYEHEMFAKIRITLNLSITSNVFISACHF